MFCFLVDQKILTYVSSVFRVNSILFVFLLQRISRVSKFRDRMTRTQHVRAWLRRSSVLLPVLGITWSFGFLTFISSTTVFHYLFTGFNTLQGFIIFVNFCVIDTEVSLSFIPLLFQTVKAAINLTKSLGLKNSMDQNSRRKRREAEENCCLWSLSILNHSL